MTVTSLPDLTQLQAEVEQLQRLKVAYAVNQDLLKGAIRLAHTTKDRKSVV